MCCMWQTERDREGQRQTEGSTRERERERERERGGRGCGLRAASKMVSTGFFKNAGNNNSQIQNCFCAKIRMVCIVLQNHVFVNNQTVIL